MNKIDEIKEDLNPVADEMWALDAFDVIVDQDGSIIAEVFDKDAAQLLGKANKHITYLLAEIERKDEALRFYADTKQYEQEKCLFDGNENDVYYEAPEIMQDLGERARAAL